MDDRSGLIAAAAGRRPVDLLLKHANVVDVYSGTVRQAHVAVQDGRVAGFGEYEANETVDLKGMYLSPGFMDAHVHIESSMACVAAFCRALLPRGVTAVAADPHEIANVLGAEGISHMLEAAEGQPVRVFYTLPSCVPATDMETSGARLEAADLEPFLAHPRVKALAEVMNFPGVVMGDPAVLAKIEAAAGRGLPVDGHAPGLSGPDLAAYVAAGVMSDHECTTIQEAEEKLSFGMRILVREGTSARNLETLLPLVNERTAPRMMWCTDDRHPHDLLEDGSIDAVVRKAIVLGCDPMIAIRMATLSPAEYFRIPDAGAVAPGMRADLVAFPDLLTPRAALVFSAGRLVAREGELIPGVEFPAGAPLSNSVNVDPAAVDFRIPAAGSRVRAVGVVPDQIVTEARNLVPRIENGFAHADPAANLAKLSVVERHTGESRAFTGFVHGLGLQRGAIASTVAHDSHNVIIAGMGDADMKAALAHIIRMGGGLAVVNGGNVLADLPLPVAGLMSDLPMPEIRDRLDRLLAAARGIGSPLHDPFMTLSFLALPVIPALKITDRGLVDVGKFDFTDLFVG